MVNLPASSLNHLTSAPLAQGGSNTGRSTSQSLADTAPATDTNTAPRSNGGSVKDNAGNASDTPSRSRATPARDSDTPSFKTLLKPQASSTTPSSQQDSSDTAAPAAASTAEPIVADQVTVAAEPSPQPTIAAAMAFLLQYQTQPLQPAPAADANSVEIANTSTNADSSKTETTAPSSLDELMQQLSALLSQMLNADAAKPAGSNIAVQDTIATTEPVQPVDGKKPAAKTPEELVALILAMLQGAVPAAPAATAQASASTSATAVIDITANTQDSSPQPTLAEVLTQLASTLSSLQEDGSTPSTADDADTKDAQSDAPSPSFFKAIAQTDTITPEALKPAADTSDLQQLINKALHLMDAQKTAADPKLIDAKLIDTKLTTTADDATQTQPVAAQTLAPVVQTQEAPKPAHLHAPVRPDLPVLEQVLVQVKNAASDGSSQIRIQLHPEDLGKVDVQMTTTAEGKTSITISSDNRNTLALLQNEARSLQDALRDIGMKTDAGGLNFNLRDSGQDARNSSRQSSAGYTKVSAVEEEDNFGFSTAGSLYRISVQQGLDISV